MRAREISSKGMARDLAGTGCVLSDLSWRAKARGGAEHLRPEHAKSDAAQHVPASAGRASSEGGFTILEILVAVSIFAVALIAIVQAMNSVQEVWQDTRARTNEFREARAAMEALTSRISQATLDTRWVMPASRDAATGRDAPLAMLPESDLHFVCGPSGTLLDSFADAAGHAIFFQAPLGYEGPKSSRQEATPEYETLPEMLCAWGYFIEFADDHGQLPQFLKSPPTGAKSTPPRRHRFRLMEFRQPAHELRLFEMTQGTDAKPVMPDLTDQRKLYEWFNEPLQESKNDQARRRATVVAENILAVILSPRSPQEREAAARGAREKEDFDIAEEYLYDSRRHQWDSGAKEAARSRHRLPPAVDILLIALDEADFAKLTESEAIQLGTQLREAVKGRFRRAEQFEDDLGSLEGDLNRRKMRYRVLRTTVAIPGGRWSTDLDLTNT